MRGHAEHLHSSLVGRVSHRRETPLSTPYVHSNPLRCWLGPCRASCAFLARSSPPTTIHCPHRRFRIANLCRPPSLLPPLPLPLLRLACALAISLRAPSPLALWLSHCSPTGPCPRSTWRACFSASPPHRPPSWRRLLQSFNASRDPFLRQHLVESSSPVLAPSRPKGKISSTDLRPAFPPDHDAENTTTTDVNLSGASSLFSLG